MIKAENLSYSFPHKELYNKISFTLEDDVHCAFIGTNGTGKSTLVNMILYPDKYLYDGKLEGLDMSVSFTPLREKKRLRYLITSVKNL